MDFKKMSDRQMIQFLRNYGKERKGELSELTNEAANRIESLLSGYSALREDDDLK